MARQVIPEVLHATEAAEGCVLFAYDDAKSPPRMARKDDHIAGTLTIGLGHTGKDVYVGQTITQAQADALLQRDLASSAARVERQVMVSLDDYQFGALVDMDFNCGAEAFATSTVLKRVNAGQFAKVPAELNRWTHTEVNHKMVESPGLVKRCAMRTALWLHSTPASGQYAAPAPMPPRNPVPVTAAAAGGAVWAGGAIASGVPLQYVVAAAAVVAILIVAVVIFIRKRK